MKKTYWTFLLPVILIILSLVLYSDTFNYGFVWDDHIIITPSISDGLKGIKEVFTDAGENANDSYHKVYRPVRQLSLLLDVSLWGLNPEMMHIMNVIYYGILCVIIFLFLKKLYRLENPWIPFLITLLFLAHTLHVEVVANIKSRDILLSSLFGFSALYVYLYFLDNSRKIWLFLMMIFFLLAFFSKIETITFTALLPVIWYYYKSPASGKINLKESAKSILIVLLPLVAFYIYKKVNNKVEGQIAVPEGEMLINIGNSLSFIKNPLDAFATKCYIILIYLKNTLLPYDLVHFSGYNYLPSVSIYSFSFLLAFIFIACIIVTTLYLLFKRSWLGFALAYIIITYSVSSHFVKPAPDTFADRFMFEPLLGYCMIFVMSLLSIFKFTDYKSFEPFIKKGILVSAFCLIYFGILSYLTTERIKVWKSDWELASADIDKLSDCALCNFHYAGLLTLRSKKNGTIAKTKNEIYKYYDKAYSIYQWPELINYYSMTAAQLGDFQLAHEVVDNYIQTKKAVKPIIYFYRGTLSYLKQDYTAAITDFMQAKKGGYNSAQLYAYLSWTYIKMNDIAAAENTSNEMIATHPNESKAYLYAGKINMVKKDFDKAIAYLEKAIAINPAELEVYQIFKQYYANGYDPQKFKIYSDAYLKYSNTPGDIMEEILPQL